MPVERRRRQGRHLSRTLRRRRRVDVRRMRRRAGNAVRVVRALVEIDDSSGASYADARRRLRHRRHPRALSRRAQNNRIVRAIPSFSGGGGRNGSMHQVHPELQDFERQMPDFFSDPSRSIDTPPSGVASSFLYGSAVWPLYLSLRFRVRHHPRRPSRPSFSTGSDDPLNDDRQRSSRRTQLRRSRKSIRSFGAWNVGTARDRVDGRLSRRLATYPGIKPQAPEATARPRSSLGFRLPSCTAARSQWTCRRSRSTPTRRATKAWSFRSTDGALDLAHPQALPAYGRPVTWSSSWLGRHHEEDGRAVYDPHRSAGPCRCGCV